ncbi:MAG: glycerate kinase, partial [Williamsia herbipolensis]|nr:glycerate kinase [Williamsia herbipolensis]
GASTGGASTDGASTDGASTDGATGGLLLDAVTGVDRSGLRPLPPGGATVLTDVTAPLCGPTGAAAVFGPQKGVTPDRIDVHDARLARWAGRFSEIDPTTPGAGAAGGVGFGLLVWGATLARGAEAVSDAVGLPAAIGPADVVVTGEGRFDGQSATGKVPAVVARLAGGRRRMLVAGAIEAAGDDFVSAASLTVIATQTTGEPDDALRDPLRFARLAGGRLARRATEHDESMRDESMHHEAERGAGAPGT